MIAEHVERERKEEMLLNILDAMCQKVEEYGDYAWFIIFNHHYMYLVCQMTIILYHVEPMI